MLQDFLIIITSNVPAAIFLIAGLILVFAEMFMPGFGIAGTLGIICLVIGVVLKAQTLLEGLIMGLTIAIITGTGFAFSLRSVAKGRLSKTPLVLSDSTSREEGFVPSLDLSSFAGRTGVALTVLRPAGVANINGIRLDVVSEGDYIMPNTSVKVVAVSGSRVVVRQTQDAPTNKR